jgi:hypothetical protein
LYGGVGQVVQYGGGIGGVYLKIIYSGRQLQKLGDGFKTLVFKTLVVETSYKNLTSQPQLQLRTDFQNAVNTLNKIN